MALLATSLALLIQTSAQGGPDLTRELDALPRSLTEEERLHLLDHPLVTRRGANPPPTSSLHCPAEYEPMDAILLAWEGPSSWNAIQARMAAQITTVGDADVYVAVDSASEGNSARNTIAAQGADMSRVTTMVVSTDSIWMRDYGPRYVYQGDVRSIVDHTYNRPRPNDNRFPTFFAGFLGQQRYDLPLIHGGGNYHLDAQRNAFTTRLINDENPLLSEQEIFDAWFDYQNVDTNFFEPFPTNIDSTQHIDMWMQVVADDVVVISDWPVDSGSIQDQICDATALQLESDGYRVFRTPARSHQGTHYTYTNVVMCNDLLLIPSYSESAITRHNSRALNKWQRACPTKTIVPIDAQALVTSAGVLHCIVMHVPRHRGGVNPTAHVIGPNGGEFLTEGDLVDIEWLSDDDVRATHVDLQLSTDGGATFPTTLASGLAPAGSFSWTVPATSSSRARIRVVAWDADGNQGFDDSDTSFVIDGADPLATATSYGAGKAGSLGVPSLAAGSLPILGEPLPLELSSALPGGSALLILGLRPASVPFDGGTLLAFPWVQLPMTIDASGEASFPWRAPGSPSLAGFPLYWQAWIPSDPAASGQGWAASNGLETVLGY